MAQIDERARRNVPNLPVETSHQRLHDRWQPEVGDQKRSAASQASQPDGTTQQASEHTQEQHMHEQTSSEGPDGSEPGVITATGPHGGLAPSDIGQSSPALADGSQAKLSLLKLSWLQAARVLKLMTPALKWPDYNKTDNVNTVIAGMWPYFFHISEAWVHEQLEPWMRDFVAQMGRGILVGLSLDVFDIGPHPLRLEAAKSYQTDEDELIVEGPIVWASRSKFRMTAHLKVLGATFSIPLEVRNLQLKAHARITARPITDTPPFIGSVTVTLLKKPHLDFDVPLALPRSLLRPLHNWHGFGEQQGQQQEQQGQVEQESTQTQQQQQQQQQQEARQEQQAAGKQQESRAAREQTEQGITGSLRHAQQTPSAGHQARHDTSVHSLRHTMPAASGQEAQPSWNAAKTDGSDSVDLHALVEHAEPEAAAETGGQHEDSTATQPGLLRKSLQKIKGTFTGKPRQNSRANVAPAKVAAAVQEALEEATTLDLMAVPVLGWAVRTAANLAARMLIMFPKGYTVEMVPGGSQRPWPEGMLTIKVIKIMGLRSEDLLGMSDPYCILQVRKGRISRTRTISNDNDPQFMEEFNMLVDSIERQALRVVVKDEDWGPTDKILGVAELPLAEAPFTLCAGVRVPFTMTLRKLKAPRHPGILTAPLNFLLGAPVNATLAGTELLSKAFKGSGTDTDTSSSSGRGGRRRHKAQGQQAPDQAAPSNGRHLPGREARKAERAKGEQHAGLARLGAAATAALQAGYRDEEEVEGVADYMGQLRRQERRQQRRGQKGQQAQATRQGEESAQQGTAQGQEDASQPRDQQQLGQQAAVPGPLAQQAPLLLQQQQGRQRQQHAQEQQQQAAQKQQAQQQQKKQSRRQRWHLSRGAWRLRHRHREMQRHASLEQQLAAWQQQEPEQQQTPPMQLQEVQQQQLPQQPVDNVEVQPPTHWQQPPQPREDTQQQQQQQQQQLPDEQEPQCGQPQVSALAQQQMQEEGPGEAGRSVLRPGQLQDQLSTEVRGTVFLEAVWTPFKRPEVPGAGAGFGSGLGPPLAYQRGQQASVHPEDKGILTVTLVRATHLTGWSAEPDPYVKFLLYDKPQRRQQKQMSSVIFNEPHPRWNQKLDFIMISAASVLVVTVMDKTTPMERILTRKFKGRFKDHAIGHIRVPVQKVAAAGRFKHEWPLVGAEQGAIELILEWYPGDVLYET